jgi:hypothetical protein
MNWIETRIFKVVSFVVLFFFSWTFGGVFDIAYAVKDSVQQSAVSGQQKQKAQKPEEKFQKTIEDIEGILADTVTDTDTKKSKLKAKKTEIESLDVEIKKQFTDTEEKIKDLPEEIKQRHRDFVKKYEDNLKEFKGDLDDIDRAKSTQEKEISFNKAKGFLEKVRPPKKHIPLDPNKLPHRTPKVEKIEPRTTPEQFLEELRAEARKSKSAEVKGAQNILIASNGSLDGLLTENTKYSPNSVIPAKAGIQGAGYPIEAFGYDSYELQPLVLAQATNLPTSADLAQNIEVQFTPEITAKAQELQNDPVKIYNWVRNNIEFVPTYGSIQGANMCLQTKLCNAFDTSSLLISLLRASNIPAKYVYGTVEIPIEKVMNWVGGFTNKMEALNLLASAGIPTKGMLVGGDVKYVRMEHIWVEAWIDYFPSRGSRHKTGQGDTWIRLDASFKQYNYTQGIDIQTAVPFDTQSFINQIQSSSTINETEGYVTGVNSTFISQTMTDYQTQVQNYITQNYPNATVGDVLGKKEIIPQEFSYLLGTLPYRTIVKGAEYASMPDTLRHKITFSVKKDAYDDITGMPINITKSLPEIAGKKITLSYSPATPQDEAVINSYLPKPHTDGTPIQPNELPTSLPAYLINLKPELRIDGTVVATGTLIGMGTTEEFIMTFIGPKVSPDVITNRIEAGEYLGIGLDLGRISEGQMIAIKTNLEATKIKLASKNFTSLTREDIIGDLLYLTALFYYSTLDVKDYIDSKTIGIFVMRMPSEALFSYELNVTKFLGTPLSASFGGTAMDVDRAMLLAKSLNGDKEKCKRFMMASGIHSSVLEHSIPEQILSTTENPVHGISAIKALQIANEDGVPIYTINQTNINTILTQLQLDGGTISDIVNAVNAGKIVTVSKKDITYQGWTGCGYIIFDPNTAEGAYMISGGNSGAMILLGFIAPLPTTLYLTNGVLSDIYDGVVLGLTQALLSQAELEIAKNYGPTADNCSHYKIQAVFIVCMEAGDNIWANIARFGLKKDFMEKGYSIEWFGKDHAKWFVYATVVAIESE